MDRGERIRARGKFIHATREKLYVRGVTYGTFRPARDGHEFPEPQVVERDFAHMVSCGLNALRTYTVPPRWLLDAASRHGLRVMVGLALERVAGYLNDGARAPDFREVARSGVSACAGHPAVLAYCVANEIPASAVRWHGRRRIERFLHMVADAARAEDPGVPVTYANYPSTEYLRLDFLDILCFNVFLESPRSFEGYLTRLQHIAGDRPLLIGEMGLDSRRHGEEHQATCLEWQVRSAFAAGCAGAFVYAWTDEWHTAAGEVTDWDFGLVRRDRSEKPALRAVRRVFSEAPFPPGGAWPRVSVVVCSYNGARTIRDCLEGIRALDYPDYEAIVVDDGSTDNTAAIAREFPVRLISTEQRGLSRARNTGLEAATGEIVAYLDDDARPDPHWLTYLARTFAATDHAAVGGPNIAPGGNGAISECVAQAPGNPVHVLLSDEEAEHIPGCNMAFRRACLSAIGGFDPRFRVAGDDVDVCWRLREAGWTLGFCPAAMVWHRPRDSIGAFWRQQRGYGRAEALLEAKWPSKYNAAGHATWSGRVYGKAIAPLLRGGGRIYHGVWGTAPFQSVYEPAPGLLRALPLMPEWFLVMGGLAALTAMGALWPPLLLAAPMLLLAVVASAAQALRGAAAARLPGCGRIQRLGRRGLVAFLHLLQPLARLRGRLQAGLTPWRASTTAGWALPWRRCEGFWSERWQPQETWVRAIEAALLERGAVVVRGGDFDRFDLEVRGGMSGAARLLVAVEEHGAGRQIVRVRSWPRLPGWGLGVTLPSAALAAGAALGGAHAAAAVFAAVALLSALRTLRECAGAAAAVKAAVAARVGGVARPLRALQAA
jgi:GT2 family glycosyltransferase